MPEESSNKRIAKNTLMLYIRMLISMLVGLYTSRVVLQTLGVEDYGIYGVVGGVVSMMGFLNASMSGATSRFITFELGRGDMQRVRDTFSSAMIIHIGIALVVILFAETVGLWFLCNKLVIPEGRMEAAHWVYQCSIISAAISITQTPYTAVIMSRENMDIYAYFELLNVGLKLVIVYLLLIGDFDKLILYSLLSLGISAFMCFLYRYYCFRHYKESHFCWIWSKDHMRPMLSFSGWDLFGNMSVMIRQQGVNFLINMFYGVAFNAASGVASMLQGVLSGLSYNIVTAFRPAIIKKYSSGEISAGVDLIYQCSKFASLLMTVLSIILIVKLDYVMTLWLENPPEMAIEFCRIMLLDGCFYVIADTIVIGIHATGKVKAASFWSGLCSLSVVPILWSLYNLGYSVEWAYIVVALANIVRLWVRAVILHRYVSFFSLFSIFSKVLLPISFVAIACFAFIYSLSVCLPNNFISLICVSLGGVTISLFLLFLCILSREQRKSLLIYVHNIVR